MSPKIPFDYHSHSPWCRHAEGPLEDYVLRAKALGLEQLGISDHLPWPKDEHPSWAMLRSELGRYVAEVRELQRRHPEIRILLSAEADFYRGREAETRELLQSAEFDYVIGSVHVMEEWSINAEEAQGAEPRDPDASWRAYYRALRGSAESGLFHVMGHCDMAKKFGLRPRSDMEGEMRATARAFAAAGVIVEINTAGLRQPCAEIYPSPRFLRILREEGVGACFGSDAHRPQDLGRDFHLALAAAESAGYDALQRWSGRGRFEAVAIKSLR